tara:strand:- start:1351 stop:1608 length:258 start_codon:yes stop_codon:yes gene_type:complete
MADDNSVQISSSISDVRVERTYTFVDSSTGLQRKATMVEFATVDDLMLVAMQSIAAEIALGVEYESIMTRDVVTDLVRTVVPAQR